MLILHQTGVEVEQEPPGGLSALADTMGTRVLDEGVLCALAKAIGQAGDRGCLLQPSGDCEWNSLEA